MSPGKAGTGAGQKVENTLRQLLQQEHAPVWTGRRLAFVLAGLLLGCGGLALAFGLRVLAEAALALALLGLALWLRLQLLPRWRDRGWTRLLVTDPSPAFVTDAAGRLVAMNPRAEALPGSGSEKITLALKGHFANPPAVLQRLQARARAEGAARDDVSSRGGTFRLTVQCLSPDRFLWRLDEVGAAVPVARGAEGALLPMLTANRQGVVLFANDAMRRLLGERPRRLDRVLKTAAAPGEVVMIDTAEGRVPALLAELTGPGDRREIYLFPLPDRPEAQDAALFDGLPVALMRFDTQGLLIDANRAARDLIDADVLAAPARQISDLFEGPGLPMQDWLADVVEARRDGRAEVVELRGTAAECFVHLALRRMSGPAGPEVLAILQDATALKRMETQYVQSQKMQAIGQLAGGIAHDFNNLLTAISGYCDLLMLRRKPGDSDWADLVQISQTANRAAALVAQLLAFSRKQPMKPERIDLTEALADLTHLLNRLVGERIDLRLTQDAGIGPVRADRRQLDQVVLNLVVNARDAMPEGGIIRLDTQDIRLTEARERGNVTLSAGRYAVIRVRDEGCAIPADRLDKIFEPFYTTKRPGEGTGLGLSTVYGIVKQSGGFIFVDSAPDQGSCFEVWMPVHAEPPETQAPDQKQAATRPAPRRKAEGVVLLVEDEAPVRAFATRALRLKGHTVLEAATGEEALEIMQDPGLSIDVFVTDVVMPGLDGPGWVMRALEARPGARVVFVSGYAEDCLTAARARVPNSVFLPKPFSLADLAATVQAQVLAGAAG